LQNLKNYAKEAKCVKQNGISVHIADIKLLNMIKIMEWQGAYIESVHIANEK